MENLTTKVYLGPMGKGTVPSGPNCVCRGESGENLDTELFVSGPQPVARGVAMPRPWTDNYMLLLRFVLYIKLTCTWLKICILICCLCYCAILL